jgi:SAM-dependent methyltransferase
MNALRNDRTRLVLFSFLMLFVELALIRWAGSNILYLSFFSNFVLLGSFLGIGLGFLRARSPRDLSPYAPAALAALVVFVAVFPVNVVSTGSELLFFGSELEPNGPPRELVLPVVFLAVALTLMLIGEGVARTFARLDALEAYKYDLIGSLIGIAGITLVSFLRLPPLVWGLIAAAVFVVLLVPDADTVRRAITVVPLLIVVAVLGVESFAAGNSWSPYYKVSTEEIDGVTKIDVNGVPHQVIWPLDAPAAELYRYTYELVPDDVPEGDDVLIIGAGSGNDVAIALEAGAAHVDAVEIDPRIRDIGRARHPARPYADPRVSSHIDDGRAWVERSGRKYDLILLALPDSITLVSGQSSLRLESYLFTEQAVESYRDQLKPGGVFAMYNYYREPWLEDRYGATLAEAFDTAPCVVRQPGLFPDAEFAYLAASNQEGRLTCPVDLWQPNADTPDPVTDDHPFPYLRDRAIPSFYLVSLGLILLASLLLVRVAAGPFRTMVPFADLFCMGVAFLLLETKYVVQFALLFGTTWLVNAFVFAGVLLSVLLAVAISKRITVRRPAILYALLLVAVAVAYVVPLSALLELAFLPRLAVAVLLAFFPIFTANLVFSERFKSTGDSTTAFGANLLGAMFGGVLEYAALITGYRLLLVIVAVFYGLAFLLGRRHLRIA